VTAIAIRRAVIADAAAIAGVHVSAWRVAYRGIVPDDVLAAQSVAARTVQWEGWLTSGNIRGESRTLVAQAGATVVGFATVVTTSPDGDLDEHTCELAALYIDPGCWRQGIGRALMDSARDLGRSQGSDEMSLWVLTENSAAQAFYAHLGFAADGATNTHERSGEPTLRMRASLRV
jgi:ribosomal protein S18 acetylase RimI-like enzyme